MNLFVKTDFDDTITSLTLLFRNKDLEKAYRDFSKKDALVFIRYAFIISIFIYGFFALLDSYLLPDFRIYLWVIRFILILPLAMLMLVISGLKTFQKNMYMFLSIFSLISGIGIIL